MADLRKWQVFYLLQVCVVAVSVWEWQADGGSLDNAALNPMFL